MMKQLVGLAIVVVLAGCSQEEQSAGTENAEICSQLSAEIAASEKATSSSLAYFGRDENVQRLEAVEDEAAGALVRVELREEVQEIDRDFESRQTLIAVYLAANNCKMDRFPDRRAYSNDADACQVARDGGDADAERLCDRREWERNEPRSESTR